LIIPWYGIFQRVTSGLKGVLELDEEEATSFSVGGGKTLTCGIGVGLAELAREVSAGYRRSGSRQIEVIVDEPEIFGFWDRTRLRRVLENLLSNAMKYSPDNGVVTIRVSSTSRDDSPWAVLTMQDQGMGIPEDDLPHIFNGLYRGKNVTAQTRGSGIGLLSVRLIVERHGGDISVESREGRGTRFRVRLPMEEHEDRLPNPT
jgi:signal transduction histidine kinase